MIKIRRNAKPSILVLNEQIWLDDLLTAHTEAERKAAEAKYNHSQIRTALRAMFEDNCAYCEAKITHVSFAHIEHYRPKARYPRLTFKWRNLLLACGICNSASYKGTNFPTARANGPIINPCNDDPNQHFNFIYDHVSKTAVVDGITPRGKITETLLGLNRYELRKHRSVHVRKLLALAPHATTDPVARQLILEAKSNDSEYKAFARSLV